MKRDKNGNLEAEWVMELPMDAYGPWQQRYIYEEQVTGKSQIRAFKKFCEERNYGYEIKDQSELMFD